MPDPGAPSSKQAAPGGKGKDAPAPPEEAPTKSRLADKWQAPTLLLAASLLIAGTMVAFMRRPVYSLDNALNRAEAAIRDERPDDGLRLLEGDVSSRLNDPGATGRARRRYYELRADARAVQIRDSASPTTAQYESMAKDYDRAMELGAALTPLRQVRYAEAMLELDRTSEALVYIRALPEDAVADRLRLLRRVIEASVRLVREPVAATVAAARADEALQLLTKFTMDAGLAERDRAWAFARQAELRLEAGEPEEALVHLLQAIPRLLDQSTPEAGELFLLLGRAYFETGRLNEATKQIAQAQRLLPPTSPAQAQAGLLLGRIARLNATPDEAREKFASVVDLFPDDPATPQALIGLAESEAAMGAYDRATEAYGRALEALNALRRPDERARQELIESVRERASERLEAADVDTAVALATLAERATAGSDPPPWVHLTLALAHREIAERALTPARLESGAVDWNRLDKVTRADVRARLTEAASRFEAHAKAMIGRDEAAYGESLWNAGDACDRAGLTENAIMIFGEFASGRPSDPRRPAASFRIAQAHQARGEHETAADIFRHLVAENPPSGERSRSLVPLARALIADADPTNDEEAERLLRQAVSGEAMTPDNPDFRVALNELGSLLHRNGRYPEAIARLVESLDRFYGGADGAPAKDPTPARVAEADLIRLLLADCHRLSARDISRALGDAMPQATRAELERLREERLREALALYEKVCAATPSRDPKRMAESERVSRRNAYFYRADCAFDLGLYDDAIRLYDEAAGRFAEDPASLVGMIQIVNVYAQSGRWDEARTAQERARQRFRELPPEAFARPDLPMDRAHWERWLESSSQLSLQAAAQAPGQPPQQERP